LSVSPWLKAANGLALTAAETAKATLAAGADAGAGAWALRSPLSGEGRVTRDEVAAVVARARVSRLHRRGCTSTAV
jgi:hypothetical protein